MYSLAFLHPLALTFPVRRSLANILPQQAEEWLYFHRGQARATVFLGDSLARTFDFTAGDTAVFPISAGESFFSAPRPVPSKPLPFISSTLKYLFNDTSIHQPSLTDHLSVSFS